AKASCKVVSLSSSKESLSDSHESLNKDVGSADDESSSKREIATLAAASSAVSETDCNEDQIKLASAKLLGECLKAAESKAHLLEVCQQFQLVQLVRFCCQQTCNRSGPERERISMNVLQNLLAYNEDTCRMLLLRLQVIDALLLQCRTTA